MESSSDCLHDVGLHRRPVLDDMTVVIPTLGRAILQDSLYRIAAGTAWPAQVIVVDQGRSAQVAQWMESLEAIGLDALYVPSSERGSAAGRNRGLERVRTRFVAFTDDDCFVHEDWLENMAVRLRKHPEAVVTGRVEAAGDEAVITVVTSQQTEMYRRPRLKYDRLSSGNMGASMVVFRRVGFFDEDVRVRTAEDTEWAYRALRTGCPLLYAPEIAVRHYGWRQEGSRYQQYRDYAHSHGGFYGKYLRKGDWFIALRAVLHHLWSLKRWVRGLIAGEKDLALHGWAYLTGLLPGILGGIRQEKTE